MIWAVATMIAVALFAVVGFRHGRQRRDAVVHVETQPRVISSDTALVDGRKTGRRS